MTNFEKIKADIQGMTVEEFYDEFCGYVKCKECNYNGEQCDDKSCHEGHIKWLESEVDNEH